MKRIISTIILVGIFLIPSIAFANDKEIINTYVDYVSSKELKSEIVLNSINLSSEDLVNKFVVNRIDYYLLNKPLLKEKNQKTYISPDKKNLDLVIKDIDKRIKRLFPNQEYKKLPSQEVAYIFFFDLLNYERIKYHETENTNYYNYAKLNINSYINEKKMLCYQLGKVGEIAMLRMGIPAISLLGYYNDKTYHLYLTFYDKDLNTWLVFDPNFENINNSRYYKKIGRVDFKTEKEYLNYSNIILDHNSNFSNNYKEILLEKFKKGDK